MDTVSVVKAREKFSDLMGKVAYAGQRIVNEVGIKGPQNSDRKRARIKVAPTMRKRHMPAFKARIVRELLSGWEPALGVRARFASALPVLKLPDSRTVVTA